MSLPKSHLLSLQPYFRSHTVELKRLRSHYEHILHEIEARKAGKWGGQPPKPYSIPGLVAELELLAKMIKAHEELLGFAQSEGLHRALAMLIENPKMASQAASNPRAYARDHGLELPKSLDIQCSVQAGRVQVRVNHYHELVPFSIEWNNEGFVPPSSRVLQHGAHTRHPIERTHFTFAPKESSKGKLKQKVSAPRATPKKLGKRSRK